MEGSIARRAVVIGAGMGGLAAAKAVAPFFGKVIVLDRDALPEDPAPRVGTPQARHAHGLLAGGQQALEELFPGIGAELSSAGAVTARAGRDVIQERPGFDPFPRRDLGFDVLCLSRPLLETLCRRRAPAGTEHRDSAAVAGRNCRAVLRSSRGRRGSLRDRQRQ